MSGRGKALAKSPRALLRVEPPDGVVWRDPSRDPSREPPPPPPPPPPWLAARARRTAAVASIALASLSCACDVESLPCSSETDSCRSTISSGPRFVVFITWSVAANLAPITCSK
eukprot:scaffold38576_cov64-Phaeocystis_antarctica.AAC.1